MEDRAFTSRYVVVMETDRPTMKKAGKIHYYYEGVATKREAEREVAHLIENNKGRKGKRIFYVDQEKQPDYVFHENTWANLT